MEYAEHQELTKALVFEGVECLSQFHSASTAIWDSDAYNKAREDDDKQMEALSFLAQRQIQLANGVALCSAGRSNVSAETLARSIFENWVNVLFIAFYRDDNWNGRKLGERFLRHAVTVRALRTHRKRTEITSLTRRHGVCDDIVAERFADVDQVVQEMPKGFSEKDVWHPFQDFTRMWATLWPTGKDFIVPTKLVDLTREQWANLKYDSWDAASGSVHASALSDVQTVWDVTYIHRALYSGFSTFETICHILGISELWNEASKDAMAQFDRITSRVMPFFPGSNDP